MKIKKDILIKYIVIILSFMAIEVLIMSTDGILIHILGLVAFSAVAIILSDLDLMHPYTWFSAFFCLYSIGFPILTYLGKENLRAAYSKELMVIQLLAFFVILFCIGPPKNTNELIREKHNINLGIFNKILYAGMIFILLGAILFLGRSDFAGKASIYASGNLILLAVFRIPLILTMLYTLLIVSAWINTNKISFITLIITGLSLLGITMYSGERDFIFRFLIISVIFLCFTGKLKKKHLIMLVPLAISILILSDKYKYFLSTGVINNSTENIILRLFSGEFESAGTNLQVVINSGMKYSLGFERYVSDVLSIFIPNISSVTSWFTNTFYLGNTVQYGFTLIGEGYVTGGIVGVILISCIVGFIIKIFYRNFNRSIYWFSAYLYLITVIIYSIRMDLGTILAAIVKQIGLVLFIVVMIEQISKIKPVRLKI